MNEQDNNNNDEQPKGNVLMLLMIVVVIVFFIKFVFPAMEKGTEPPSSLLTGEVSCVRMVS